jgi:hypothetical protein
MIARAAIASIASRFACRDDRDTPLLTRRDGSSVLLIYRISKAKYFSSGDWTTFSQNCRDGQISHGV